MPNCWSVRIGKLLVYFRLFKGQYEDAIRRGDTVPKFRPPKPIFSDGLSTMVTLLNDILFLLSPTFK
jgi:hypothetical protein